MGASTSLALKSFMKSAESMAFTAELFEFMNCTHHRVWDVSPYCQSLHHGANRPSCLFYILLFKEIEFNVNIVMLISIFLFPKGAVVLNSQSKFDI